MSDESRLHTPPLTKTSDGRVHPELPAKQAFLHGHRRWAVNVVLKLVGSSHPVMASRRLFIAPLFPPLVGTCAALARSSASWKILLQKSSSWLFLPLRAFLASPSLVFNYLQPSIRIRHMQPRGGRLYFSGCSCGDAVFETRCRSNVGFH